MNRREAIGGLFVFPTLFKAWDRNEDNLAKVWKLNPNGQWVEVQMKDLNVGETFKIEGQTPPFEGVVRQPPYWNSEIKAYITSCVPRPKESV